MKVGDKIKKYSHNTNVKSFKIDGKWDGADYKLNEFTGRVIKEIEGNLFQLEGDFSTWFKINDFESEPQYEIY